RASKPAKRRGRPPNRQRDRVLVGVIKHLVDAYGLDPTRNRATTTAESGCSLVAQVLRELGYEKTDEAGLEKVWGHRPRDFRFGRFSTSRLRLDVTLSEITFGTLGSAVRQKYSVFSSYDN